MCERSGENLRSVLYARLLKAPLAVHDGMSSRGDLSWERFFGLAFPITSILVITLRPEEAQKSHPSMCLRVFNVFTTMVGTCLAFWLSKPDSLNVSERNRARKGVPLISLCSVSEEWALQSCKRSRISQRSP